MPSALKHTLFIVVPLIVDLRGAARRLPEPSAAVQFRDLPDPRPGREHHLRLHRLSAVRLCRLLRRRRLRLCDPGDALPGAGGARGAGCRTGRRCARTVADAAAAAVRRLFRHRQSRGVAGGAALRRQPRAREHHPRALRRLAHRHLQSDTGLCGGAGRAGADAGRRRVPEELAALASPCRRCARTRSAPRWPASMWCGCG